MSRFWKNSEKINSYKMGKKIVRPPILADFLSLMYSKRFPGKKFEFYRGEKELAYGPKFDEKF